MRYASACPITPSHYTNSVAIWSNQVQENIFSHAMKQSDKIMPLLMCPSCNEGMREVNHNNLQIDVDPKCRGVWLDRGELETLRKLLRVRTRKAWLSR